MNTKFDHTNVSSQLKGWAVDKAISMDFTNVDDAIDAAKKLVEYCYSPEETISEMEMRIAEMKDQEQALQAVAMTPASNRGAV